MDAPCRGCSVSNKQPRLRRVRLSLPETFWTRTNGHRWTGSCVLLRQRGYAEDQTRSHMGILDHGVDDTRRQRREPKLLQISQVLDVSQPEDNFYRAQRGE